MSIVWVHEALSSGSGVAEHDSGNKFSRVFDVLTDDYDDNAITVANAEDPVTALAIPAPYSYFSKGNDSDYGSIVTRIIPDRDQGYPLLWHVRVEYTVLRADTETGQWPTGTVDITNRLPNFRIWGIPVAEVISTDAESGEQIANSAGQQYNPLPEDVYYITAVEITTWIRTYDADYWEGFANTTNADPIWNRAEETLLMVGPPSGVRKIDTYGTYWEVKLEIHWNKKGWKKNIPDMGTVKLVDDDGNDAGPGTNYIATGVAPITDKAGVRVTQDVPLDGQGQPLAHGLPWVIKSWTVKEKVLWNKIGLPDINVTWS